MIFLSRQLGILQHFRYSRSNHVALFCFSHLVVCWHRFEYKHTRPECVSESQTARYDRLVNFDGQWAVCRLSDKNAFGLTLHFFSSLLLFFFIHVFFAKILLPLLIHWCDHKHFSREPASLVFGVLLFSISIGVCFVHVRRVLGLFHFYLLLLWFYRRLSRTRTHCDLHARPWYLSRVE